MKPLSSQARAYLDALRVVDSPDDATTARVLAGVLDRAASGDLGPNLPQAPTPAASAGIGVSAKAIAIAAALAGALAGALAAAAADDAAPAEPVVPALGGLGAIAPVPVPEVTPIAPPPVIAPAIEPPVRPARPTAKVGRPARARAVDPIAEEVALLSEARAALGAGDAHAAISVLRRHARRFADGVLAREREVSWITALCVLGDDAGARRRADAFLRDHGDSPHAAKVKASCGGR